MAAVNMSAELAAINRSVQLARKGLRPSNLGGLRPDGTPKRPEYQVGQQPALLAISEGLKRLRELGFEQPRSTDGLGLDLSEGERLMSRLKNWKGDLKDNRSQMLAVTGRDRAAQREAIQANASIMAGIRRPSSARIPRLARGAGLLAPFSTLEPLI